MYFREDHLQLKQVNLWSEKGKAAVRDIVAGVYELKAIAISPGSKIEFAATYHDGKEVKTTQTRGLSYGMSVFFKQAMKASAVFLENVAWKGTTTL